MGHGIHVLILHTVRGHPESADKIVIRAAVGCAFERIVEHHHHAIFVGFRLSGFHELQLIVVVIVKLLHFLEEPVGIHFHVLPFESGCCREVVAEAFCPEEDHVVGGFGASPIPLAVFVFQIHGAQLLRNVDLLSGGRSRLVRIIRSHHRFVRFVGSLFRVVAAGGQ